MKFILVPCGWLDLPALRLERKLVRIFFSRDYRTAKENCPISRFPCCLIYDVSFSTFTSIRICTIYVYLSDRQAANLKFTGSFQGLGHWFRPSRCCQSGAICKRGDPGANKTFTSRPIKTEGDRLLEAGEHEKFVRIGSRCGIVGGARGLNLTWVSGGGCWFRSWFGSFSVWDIVLLTNAAYCIYLFSILCSFFKRDDKVSSFKQRIRLAGIITVLQSYFRGARIFLPCR